MLCCRLVRCGPLKTQRVTKNKKNGLRSIPQPCILHLILYNDVRSTVVTKKDKIEPRPQVDISIPGPQTRMLAELCHRHLKLHTLSKEMYDELEVEDLDHTSRRHKEEDPSQRAPHHGDSTTPHRQNIKDASFNILRPSREPLVKVSPGSPIPPMPGGERPVRVFLHCRVSLLRRRSWVRIVSLA